MQELVAVNAPFTMHNFSSETLRLDIPLLKREALMFDRIAIPRCTEPFVTAEKLPAAFNDYKEDIRDLRWLYELGIVFEPSQFYSKSISGNEYMRDVDLAFKHGKKICSLLLGFDLADALSDTHIDEKKKVELKAQLDRFAERILTDFKEAATTDGFKKNLVMTMGYATRILSTTLRVLNNLDAFPVMPGDFFDSERTEGNKNDVIEIVLNELPVPDESTPWEHILEYRSDPDSRRKFASLRSWMSEIARMQLGTNEIQEKLESLIHDYRQHMKIHRLKTKLDTLKTILIAEAGLFTGGWLTGAGAIPGILGMVATPLYSIKQRQVALMEEEQKAPGREIAYIVKAKDTFQ
jgi:hypothetical protein